MDISAAAALALRLLEQSEFEGWLVGGCVRDFLMGLCAHDIDIATSAEPAQVLKVFRDYHTVKTGLKHGTVTVWIESMPLEITTYRVDGSYTDHRRPDKVCFTKSLQEDLARRDFTINAIAWHPVNGYADPFDGRADIETKTIRAVGDARLRFEEDTLRILRGLRFCSTLGFTIEPVTFAAMCRQKALLHNVSAERTAVELLKTLTGQNAARALETGLDIWGELLPELLLMRGFEQCNPFHCYDLLTHTLHVLQAVPPEPVLRLAALWHDIGKPQTFSLDECGIGHFYGHAAKSEEIARVQMEHFRLDNATCQQVLALIRLHDHNILPDKRQLKRCLCCMTPELFFCLIQLQKADADAQSKCGAVRLRQLILAEQMAREILAQQDCFSLCQLAVNGRDLIACGVPQGQRVGQLLRKLLLLVMHDTLDNSKEELLAFVREALSQEQSK